MIRLLGKKKNVNLIVRNPRPDRNRELVRLIEKEQDLLFELQYTRQAIRDHRGGIL